MLPGRSLFAATFTLLSFVPGCAVGRQMVAPNDDFADYREYRMAAHPGVRLRRAHEYLSRHTDGTFAGEVAAAFDEEENVYFERSKASRAGARDYLADLPDGPHAPQALAAIVAFDSRVDDVETARLLRDARKTERLLEQAANQRRKVSETLVAWVVAAARREVFERPAAELRGALRDALGPGATKATVEMFYSVPTLRERQSRLLQITLELAEDGGTLARITIEGEGLFARWAEADTMQALADDDESAKARAHVRDVLAGALEAAMPAARCGKTDGSADAFFARACDHLRVVATWGPKGRDRIVIGRE